MSYGFVYCTTNLTNSKRYVGKRKFQNSKKDDTYLGSGKILKQAIQKEGIEVFERVIICVCESEEELKIREVEFIYELETLYPKGYNILSTSGGGDMLKHHPNKEEMNKKKGPKKGFLFSKDRNDKISKALKGIKRTDKARVNNSNAQKNPETNLKKVTSRRNNGRPWHSEETRVKMSVKKIGKVHTEQWKSNHSQKLKGRSRPESEKQRLMKFMTDGSNKIPCEFCNRMLNRNNYKQHTNKCPLKPQ